MVKKVKCKHCAGLFLPIRHGHIYCSDTCRKLQHKAKIRAKTQVKNRRRLNEKLLKLSSSAFGKYLIRELKRAGTVQALHSHTSDTLKELTLLRSKCTSASGYEDGRPLNTYELSHIYPVNDPKAIGLITPKNLTIAPAKFNRKHASKKPSANNQGDFLPRNTLLPKWQIPDKSEAIEILRLARKFIGKDFDKWLRSHTVSPTQRQALIKKLKEQGLPEKMLQDLNIEKLKNLAEEQDLSYFNTSESPENPRDIAIRELKRLGLDPELLEVLEYLQEYDWSLEDPSVEFIGDKDERLSLEHYLTNQALACIHGQPYLKEYKNKNILSYFKQRPEVIWHSNLKEDLDDEIL
jgi:hypothetical protein